MNEGIDAQELINKLSARIGELMVNIEMLNITIEKLRAKESPDVTEQSS